VGLSLAAITAPTIGCRVPKDEHRERSRARGSGRATWRTPERRAGWESRLGREFCRLPRTAACLDESRRSRGKRGIQPFVAERTDSIAHLVPM